MWKNEEKFVSSWEEALSLMPKGERDLDPLESVALPRFIPFLF
jgi:hypothetical protein